MSGEVVGRLEDFTLFGRLAGIEGCSRILQIALNICYERVRATEHALRGPRRLHQDCHCLAEMVERGSIVTKERRRVIPPHPERAMIILPENTSRNGNYSTRKCLGFFEAQ